MTGAWNISISPPNPREHSRRGGRDLGDVAARMSATDQLVGRLRFHVEQDSTGPVQVIDVEVANAAQDQGVASGMLSALIDAYPDRALTSQDSSDSSCEGVRWMNRQRRRGRWIHAHWCISRSAPSCGCGFTEFEVHPMRPTLLL